MASKKIRVPETTVEMILMLATILRDHIKIQLVGTECWTFEHTADWEIRLKENEEGYPFYGGPEHKMNVYLGTGKCWAFNYKDVAGPVKKLDIRVRLEYSKWVPMDMSYWDIQIWIKLPDNSVVAHHYESHTNFGSESYGHRTTEVSAVTDRFIKMDPNPPRKIAFWKETEKATT
jgi:hypothetical protein